MINGLSIDELPSVNQGEMVKDQILLVAEQDSEGHVIAVWKVARGEKTARPMRRNDLDRESRAGASFHGGPESEILAYIDMLPGTEGPRA
jgi:hypothetical protein